MNNKIERDLLISELIYKHLRGELSAEEQEMLKSWLGNPENEAFFSDLENTDRIYQKMLYVQEVDTDAHFRKLQAKIEGKKKMRRLPWWIGLAATLVIGVGLLWRGQKEQVVEQPFQAVPDYRMADQTVLHTPEGRVVYLADTVKELGPKDANKKVKTVAPVIMPQPLAFKYNVLATSSRGKIEVMLSDSSRVWLNSGSELKYPDVFGHDRREVYLTGEAYFEVAKNPKRPFIVNTGDHKIEVLGTQFNVKVADPQHCVATLVEGCIRMRNKLNDTLVLYPGQQAQTRMDGSMQLQEVDYRYDIAWKKNQFGFHEVTLFSIMNELSEWYDFTFEIENMTLANQIYTAIVPRYQNPDDVLQILQCTEDFVYTEDANRHITIRQK